jgi:hypothetical protein
VTERRFVRVVNADNSVFVRRSLDHSEQYRLRSRRKPRPVLHDSRQVAESTGYVSAGNTAGGTWKHRDFCCVCGVCIHVTKLNAVGDSPRKAFRNFVAVLWQSGFRTSPKPSSKPVQNQCITLFRSSLCASFPISRGHSSARLLISGSKVRVLRGALFIFHTITPNTNTH